MSRRNRVTVNITGPKRLERQASVAQEIEKDVKGEDNGNQLQDGSLDEGSGGVDQP